MSAVVNDAAGNPLPGGLNAGAGVDDVAAAVGPPIALSGLDRLRARVEAVDEDTTGDADIPSGLLMPVPFPKLPENGLVAEYRIATRRDRLAVEKRAKKRHGNGNPIPKNWEHSVRLAADLLATTCVGIYTREETDTDEGYKLEPVTSHDGSTVVFDAGLADALGLEGAESNIEILILAFGGVDQPIVNQGSTYNTWTANPTGDRDPFGVL